MTLSQAAIMSTSLFFVLWPQLSGGLLSDFKICGDSQCESLMSRVQAVRDHHGKDCRFLSFRKGETIFVYHKLTGKRSHLWAGSMNKQFGYFPKEAVKEEQTYATKEIVVVTQESDFLCINEFGYLIDSSHLNTNDDDDDDDDDSGLKNPEELETSQTRNHPDDTNARMSKDSAPESFSTSREEIENRDNGAAKTKQESPETAVELKEKGGSPASSWLSSSVTGWFGVGKKEEPENSAEVNEKRLMPGEDLLPSSVAGWLGLRSEGKSDSAKHDENQEKQDRKTVESSTMTGWLGFGGDEKPDSSAEKENDDESELDVKTAAGENFRSRKLHLEIETLAEQEKKINDMGTLGWLANGLSTTLGFGLDDQDTRETIQVSTEEVDVKETASSWFDLGISSILAFRKNNNEGDRTESHTQSDNILQGHVDSNIQDTPANNKDSEVDDASQVDQNANPPQNQRTDINLVPNGKEGKNTFDILVRKNDVTSLPVLTYTESRSVDQSVSEIDSAKDSDEEANIHELRNQVGQVVDKFNISCVDDVSDEECKRERRDKDIIMPDEYAEQSQGQESGSSPASETEVKESEEDDKKEEVHNKEKSEDTDEQKNVEDNQEDMEEVVEKEELEEESQEEFKDIARQEHWNAIDNNTQEEKPLEFGSDHLKKRDAEMIHENLSEEDKQKRSVDGSTPSQDAKDMDHPYLQGRFVSVINFLKESSFVSSLTPQKEEKESKEDEELDREEKKDNIKTEQEYSPLIAKQEETVERQEKHPEEFPSREKPATSERFQVKAPEELIAMEQLHHKKPGELIKKDKQDDAEELKDTRKEGVHELMQKEKVEDFEDEKQEEMKMLVEKKHEVGDESVDKIEEKKQKQLFEKKLDDLKWGMFREQDNPTTMKVPDDNKHGKLKNFMRKREVEDFEDEKQEGLERGEKGEMVEALEEKMPEEAELKAEKGEEFTDGQKQHEVERLEKTKYDVSGASREEFEGDKQEEFEDREQEGVEKFEEEKHKVDGVSVEGLEDKIQEDLEHEEEGIAFDEELEEVGKLEKYEEDGESVEELEEEENMETEKVKEQEEAGELEESNKSRQDDLNGILKKEEVEENRKEGVSKWNFVEDSGEGTQEELAQVEEDEKQEFNRELKVSEDMQNAGDFVDSKNVNEETESLECMDELCTQFEQDEIIREREKRGFDHGSNLQYHASTLTDVLLADRTQEDPEVTLEDVEHDLIGLSFHQTDQFDEKSDIAIESGGEFDHLKKAIIPSSQKPIMKIKELTESPSGFDGKTNEMSNSQPLPSPKHALDSTTNSDKDLQTNFQPPSPSLTQTSPSTYLPPNTAKPQQPNPLSKTYKTLQDHMSTQETSILTDMFGKKNLKKLDDILGHADVFTEDVDRDESVLVDIEAILHDHWEILFPPSMRLSDAPEEDKEKTGTRIAIQKLEILLKRARDIFDTRKSDINRANAQAQPSCIGASCSTSSKDKETMETVGVMVHEQNDGGPEKNQEDDNERGSEEMPREENIKKMSHSQTAPPQLLEGVAVKIQDSIHRIQKQSSSQTHGMDFVKWLKIKVVSSLPYDLRPGPDLYGIPWELIIISSLVGLVTLLFSCRCYSSVKSRLYRRKEWRMAEQVAQLLEEKCEVLETLSKCQQEYDELETLLSESGTSAQTQELDLEVRAQQLDLANTQLEESLQELKDELDQQRLHREEQEQKVTLLEQSMETIQEETKELQSQEQQAQTTIKVYDMNSERLQRNQETAGEENSLLKESNTQLSQQVEGWAERVSELEEEMRRYELAHSGMVQDVANKDERIMSLTDRLLGMKAWDADLEEDGGDASKGATGRAERNGKVDGTKSEIHLQKVQKLIYAAKLNADLKSVDEDKDRVFAKLNDEVKAKEDLEVSIKELENERLSMQADTEHYNEQVQRLQQKLQIMTEMYQENELKLHRLLTVEEKERLQKEDKLNKADKNIALAMEELNNYKLRAGEMEEELEKTKQSYQTQISAHEKKAHNNWLAARAADRELSDIKRENALLRQKLTDTQFKLDALDREPFTLDSVARPLPFRAERLPFGPSPLGRPASENRALLSPPTLLEGPLNRLSPRGTRGPVEPPGAHGELEQSGGAHSDSGSISPSWERDRRGPPLGAPGPFPPQGYMFPEPGGPIYRRPGPPPGVMAPLPPPGPPFPHPRALPNSGPLGPIHSADTTDGTNRENSLGPEHDHQEPTPSDGRTPPLRRGTAPPSGPPMGPIDGPFPRRAPFGPPDFFPPRGPGGPPMMPMWAPRPGLMFPPRYAHGGPPPPPHPLSYGPPMRPPPPDGLPPPSVGPPMSQQNLPPVPRSQSQDELTSAP